MTDPSTVAIVVSEVDDTTVTFDIINDPAVAAYWDAVTEVRRFWQATRHTPATTTPAKRDRLARLTQLISAAEDAAQALGLDFTADDYM